MEEVDCEVGGAREEVREHADQLPLGVAQARVGAECEREEQVERADRGARFALGLAVRDEEREHDRHLGHVHLPEAERGIAKVTN